MRTPQRLELGTGALAALLLVGPLLTGCMSWDDTFKLHAEVVASDGVTPVPLLNLDAYDINMVMWDDTPVVRRIDFTTAQQYAVNLSTDANGMWDLITPDLHLSAQKEVRECTDICVDRDDDTGACIDYVRDCRDVLKTYYYGVDDVQDSASQISFRLAGGAVVTVVGTKIDHGYDEIEHDSGRGERVWLSSDRFITPIAPQSAPSSGSQSVQGENSYTLSPAPGVKFYMGAPRTVMYENASDAFKAKVDKIVSGFVTKKPPIPTPPQATKKAAN